ncbi:hypothetical protein QR680_018125 [Steinernema hermaphroditum]|uniref:Mediator complex subunit Med12 domain-containing protein n=1 Tax=Steinernema hermaphroditum TaxID=289476 RepID=A0AA39HGY6_9BILA|nr:hypothetical protein QR680_018125 [Steinernema hermaphroditum]
MYKQLGVSSWHDAKQEKKPLNRSHRSSRAVPDVYPQEVRQEEDSMAPQRLKSGYIVNVPAYEQDSLYKTGKFDKFVEDGLLRCGKMVTQIMQTKNEHNTKAMSRQRSMNKDGTSNQQFIHNTSTQKTKERTQWFLDLAHLKSFMYLVRRPPYVKKKEECFDLLFDFRVPSHRACWFLKLHTVSHMSSSSSSKGKQKSSNEVVFPDQSTSICRAIGDTVVKLNEYTSADISKNIAFWNYMVHLFKHCVEDGLVDRQDFLMEMSEILHAQMSYPMDKPHAFRFLLQFFTQFIQIVTQNVILARRVAHIAATRLRMYKTEFDRSKRRKSESDTWYTDLLGCQHHRPILFQLTGIIHAVMVSCPQALTWNSFRVSSPQTLPNQLCGSPLDILPCTPDELPIPHGPSREGLLFVLKSKLAEIRQRSWAVKRHWALNSNDENTFTMTVERVLAIITALDTVDVTDAKGIIKAYVKVFGTSLTEKFEYQTAITIKVMLQWAVTAQRGESYRISVVIALLNMHLKRFRDSSFIGSNTRIQDVLMEYLSIESPEPGQPHFSDEYRYLMFLFYELQREGIFSHDKYVQDLIRTGDLVHAQPVMMKLRDGGGPPEDKENAEDKENGKEQRDDSLRPPVLQKAVEKVPKENSKTELIDDEPDYHILMSKNDNLSRHERFLIQLPIQQIERNRSDRNQRLIMLYGIGEDREQATVTQKRIADNIVKIWQKKVNLEIPDLSKTLTDVSSKENMQNKEVRFRRKPPENYIDCINTFKTQTYYDQHVIAAICADSFLEMFSDFLYKGGTMIPTSESLDVLFYLLEYCMNINEIISFSVELISLLIKCDREMIARQIPIIPGSASAQHGHVIAAYLSSHYQYFLMHSDASKVLRGLFELVEPQIRPKDKDGMSAWSRSIAVFMLTAKMDLTKANRGADLVEVGKFADLKSVFPSSEVPLSSPKYANGDRETAFTELMKDLKVRRFMNYHEFKKKLSILKQSSGAGISLVVAAYNAALDSGRRIEVLSDIATVVAHFAANTSLEADIYVVIDELCCSQQCKDKVLPMSSRLKTEDVEQLYAMAALTALLAAKHCISGHALIMRLLQGVFKPFTSSPIAGTDKLEHMYRGLLLGTFIISMLICGTDLPFCVDPIKQEKPQERMPADVRSIRTLFIRELSDTLMPLLSILFLVAEPDKGDDDRSNSRVAWYKAPQYTTSLQPILKAAIRAICEQDWVNQRVFALCEKGRVEMFAKLRSNAQGQKIIRLALRRRCERELKEELIYCTESTVKILVTKLFSTMNVWNMRAIIYDLRLMIKENEKIEKGQNQFAQNQMLHFYDNLTQTIAQACREFFLTLSPEKEGVYPEIKVGKGFQLNQVNPLWLIAPLMQTCPQPSLRSTSNHINVNSVQQKFLKEAQGMLNYQNDQNRTWLLSQKPFLNLLYTSLEGEDQLRDALVGSLLKQFSEIANRARDSNGLPFSKQFKNEREGLIVRLSLCGGMFESMLSMADAWALELFKLLFYEVISQDRDPLVYEMCYDMLNTLIVYTIVENHQNVDGEDPRSGSKYSPQDDQSNHSQSSALPNKYRGLMKKLSKEIADRTPSGMKELFKLLPIPKPMFDVPVVDAYGAPPASSSSKSSKSSSSSSQFASSQSGSNSSASVTHRSNTRYGVQYNGRREQMTTFDFIQGYFADQMPKHWKWSWFQTTKMDRTPIPNQKQILRMLYHTHYLEYARPAVLGLERPARADIFLTPPMTEEAPPTPHNAPTPHAPAPNQTNMHGPMSVGQPPSVPPMAMGMGQMMPPNTSGTAADPSQINPQNMVTPNSVPSSMPPSSMHSGFPGPAGPHGMSHPMQGPVGMPGPPHPEFGGMRPPFPGNPMGMMGNPQGMVGMGAMRGPHQQPVRAAVAAGARKRANASGPKNTSKRRKDSKTNVAAGMPDMQISGSSGYWPNANQGGFAGPQPGGYMGQPAPSGGPMESHGGQDSKAQLHEMLINRQKQAGANPGAQHSQNAFGSGGPGGAPHYPMMAQPDHQGGFTQNAGQTGQRYM